MMSLMLSLWEGMGRNASGRFYRINSNDGLLSDNPKLGHITTFGDTLSLRQPVCATLGNYRKPT
jgi:hypothetical protein